MASRRIASVCSTLTGLAARQACSTLPSTASVARGFTTLNDSETQQKFAKFSTAAAASMGLGLMVTCAMADDSAKKSVTIETPAGQKVVVLPPDEAGWSVKVEKVKAKETAPPQVGHGLHGHCMGTDAWATWALMHGH